MSETKQNRSLAEQGSVDFPDLLLTRVVGARTVRTVAMVAEVFYGTPCRFGDHGRFSLAHWWQGPASLQRAAEGLRRGIRAFRGGRGSDDFGAMQGNLLVFKDADFCD